MFLAETKDIFYNHNNVIKKFDESFILMNEEIFLDALYSNRNIIFSEDQKKQTN